MLVFIFKYLLRHRGGVSETVPLFLCDKIWKEKIYNLLSDYFLLEVDCMERFSAAGKQRTK